MERKRENGEKEMRRKKRWAQKGEGGRGGKRQKGERKIGREAKRKR